MVENVSKTILAVDDNDALRYSLLRSLQAGGFRVLEARNGSEARRLAEVNPDLITLDVNLPDIDGFEVCRRIKANPKTSHIPILHISATYTDTECKLRGLEAADGYLAEPVSREELLASVNALLRLKQAETEARLQAAEAEKARQALQQAHSELEARVQRRTEELSRKSEEIRKLGVKLMTLQDEERRRIARELHDSTGQMLAAMKMMLDNMSREAKGSKIAGMVTEVAAVNDDLSRQLRTMSYLLHPPLLDEVGLPSALEWYIDGFANRSGIKVDLEISPGFGRLSSEMEIALFRVAQECLTNIHRHANSPTARIRLSRNAEQTVLEIADSGKGIPAGRLRDGSVVPGVGLMGIQERMQELGGITEIRSSEGGTIVTMTIKAK